MIDWTTLLFEDLYIDLPVGSICRFKHDGEIEQMTELSYQLKHGEGSFSENVTVRNSARGLKIDGNPSKWLQAHNLFGRDSWEIVTRWIYDVAKRLNNISIIRAFELGQYSVRRIDITYNFSVPDVDSYLLAIKQFAHGRYGVPTANRGTTVYFNQNSKRSAVKFYNKAKEINAHPFNPHRIDQEQEQLLRVYAHDLLRCEVVLRGKYLDDTYGKKIDWENFDFYAAWKTRIDNITFPTSVELRHDDMNDLNGRQKLIYSAWRNGENIKELYNKSQFYAYRKFFLEYGIDIATPAPKAAQCKIIPLFRPVEAIAKPIPEEAYKLRLVA